MWTKHNIIFVLFLLLSRLISFAQVSENSLHTGLSFVGPEENQDRRTGLNLSPEKDLKFSKEGFSVAFKLKLKEKNQTYGYVCRVISDDSSSLDLISHASTSNFKLSLVGDDNTIVSKSIEYSKRINKKEWVNVSLSFNKENIIVRINDIEEIIDSSLPSFENIKIYFGVNDHERFYTTDAPPIIIKEISIKDHKEKLLHRWPLSTHNNNEVYDEVTQNVAKAKNPIWDIDQHSKWNKVRSLSIYTNNTDDYPLPQIAYDSINGRIFIVTSNDILTYYIDNDKVEKETPIGGQPYLSAGSTSHIVYDNKHNRLISYSPDLSGLNFYNFKDKTWSQEKRSRTYRYQHHNKFIDYENNRLIVFGGYGFFRYSADISEININDTARWESITSQRDIWPRYLSALGRLDKDNILILGGYGSPSGKQEESPRNYYDLHKINLDTKESNLLWSFDSGPNHYTFSNSMYVDNETNTLYAMAFNNDRYNSNLFLVNFDLKTSIPSMRILSDSIQYKFLDIRSFSDLFLYNKTSTLYALIQQESSSKDSTTINIYSLAYPPISQKDIQILELSKKGNNNKATILLLISIVLLSAIIAFLSIYKKKQKKTQTKKNYQPSSLQLAPTDKNNHKPKISNIRLLGGFRIYDRNGDEITAEFSPTIKQLMIYFLLSSIKNSASITSQILDETFWFGMEKESAANNRRVNIRKLRLLLEKIGDIEITNKNNYWQLNIGETVYCDYKNILQLLTTFKKSNYSDRDTIEQILDIASSGSLLSSIETEWIDSYKSEFSIDLIEVLSETLKQPYFSKDSKFLLKISDTILIHDNIDENAIRIKCKILYDMKQKGLSKQTYNKFREDYFRLLNTDPELSYEEIIQDT